MLEHAEDAERRAGPDSLYLYTHEKMTENLALCERIGYVEYDRRTYGAASIVYLRKGGEPSWKAAPEPPRPSRSTR